MGRTWDEFKRQCGLFVAVFRKPQSYRRFRQLRRDDEITVERLAILQKALLPPKNRGESDDRLDCMNKLIRDLTSSGVRTCGQVADLVAAKLSEVLRSDKECATNNAKKLGEPLANETASTTRARQRARAGVFYTHVGLMRVCLQRANEEELTVDGLIAIQRMMLPAGNRRWEDEDDANQHDLLRRLKHDGIKTKASLQCLIEKHLSSALTDDRIAAKRICNSRHEKRDIVLSRAKYGYFYTHMGLVAQCLMKERESKHEKA